MRRRASGRDPRGAWVTRLAGMEAQEAARLGRGKEPTDQQVDARRRWRLEIRRPIEAVPAERGARRREPRESSASWMRQRRHESPSALERTDGSKVTIAPEDLVPTEAGEHDREPGFARGPRDAPRIQAIRRRLVHGGEEAGQLVEDGAR